MKLPIVASSSHCIRQILSSWVIAAERKRWAATAVVKVKNVAIDIPVAEEPAPESVPEAYKIVLIGDRAVGKSRFSLFSW